MHLEESKRILRNSPLFRDMNEIHLDLVLMVCEEVSYDEEDTIFHQGEEGDALYIIAQGEVAIVLESEDEETEKEILLAVLQQDETFGETVLIDKGHRSASARCRTPVQLLRLPRERLLRLASDYPEIGFRMMRRMANELLFKLHEANLRIRETLVRTPEAPETEVAS
jgi:CRP-like cAMP-binding protein